jgi:hypothetical protein
MMGFELIGTKLIGFFYEGLPKNHMHEGLRKPLPYQWICREFSFASGGLYKRSMQLEKKIA